MFWGFYGGCTNLSSPTPPGPRLFEPCLATAQGLPATSTPTLALGRTTIDPTGLYPGTARPAKTPTRILMGSNSVTTPAIQRAGMVEEEATLETAQEGVQRQ